MTILPKKKASAAGVSSERAEDSEQHVHPHPHPLGVRSGTRPRASPPPWPSYPTEDPRGVAEAPAHLGAAPAAAPGAHFEGLGELPCCSGPGLSKRRRQAGSTGGIAGGGGGSPASDTEEGAAGNNSEDEYETGLRLQAVDPATVEQVINKNNHQNQHSTDRQY